MSRGGGARGRKPPASSLPEGWGGAEAVQGAGWRPGQGFSLPLRNGPPGCRCRAEPRRRRRAGPGDTPSRRAVAARREEASEPRPVQSAAGTPRARVQGRPRPAPGPSPAHSASRALELRQRHGSLRCVGGAPALGSLGAGVPPSLPPRALWPPAALRAPPAPHSAGPLWGRTRVLSLLFPSSLSQTAHPDCAPSPFPACGANLCSPCRTLLCPHLRSLRFSLVTSSLGPSEGRFPSSSNSACEPRVRVEKKAESRLVGAGETLLGPADRGRPGSPSLAPGDLRRPGGHQPASSTLGFVFFVWNFDGNLGTPFL